MLNKLHKNQNGFAIVETLLIVFIIAALVGIGLYVWHADKQANATLSSASQVAKSSPKKIHKRQSDITVSWKTYVSKAGKFSVKYPASWVQPTNQNLCGDYLERDLEIGPDAGSVIKCGSDGTVSQVSIASVDGDHQEESIARLKGSGYGQQEALQGALSHGALTGGMRAVAMHQGSDVGSLPDGAIVEIATFFKNNVTFVATYTQYPAIAHEGPIQEQSLIFDNITSTLRMEPYSDDRSEGP